MFDITNKQIRRHRRQLRVRRRLLGDSDRPRLAVFRSSKHIYAQIINDVDGKTLVAASTADRDVRSQMKSGSNKQAAELVGSVLGQRAKEKGIGRVAFDRRHYKYHGRIQALADGARKAGLQF